jgi:hypothetical protein
MRSRVSAALTVTVLASFLFGPMWAGAQAGAQVGGSVNQTGWWNRTNAVPSAPAPGVTLPAVTVPAPPSVPAGSIAVSATAGTIDKVAAIGIVPEATSGDVSRAVLSVRESATGQQVNNTSPDAVIVACPITEFWVGGENGAWPSQPPNSCSTAKVVGARGGDGTWTFDLTPIAAQWLTPGALEPNGVALLPEVATGSTATFQVVLDGDVSAIGLDLAATPAAPRTTTSPVTTIAAGGGGGGATGPSQTGGSRPATSPSTPAATTPVGAPAGTPTTKAATPATPTVPVAASGSESTFGDLPAGVIPLALAALIVAALLMIALGPLGEPATGVAREGGVSRALAAREKSSAEPTLTLETP